jgi:proline iminopeptidase
VSRPPLSAGLRRDGLLDVGDGQLVWWGEFGAADGIPLLLVHGGPGGGSVPAMMSPFDPGAYRMVLFDQRGSGRSTPHASDPRVSLASNTTAHLVADMERLRVALGIERWVLCGSSWGTTLALAYALAHPDRVLGMILRSITTCSPSELAWVYRDGANHLLPERWEELTTALPVAERDDLVTSFHARVGALDDAVRIPAALAWCRWETAGMLSTPDPVVEAVFADPRFAVAFARISTHYAVHQGFPEDGPLLDRAGELAGIPGVLVQGRYDLCTPPVTAWRLHRAWPGSRLHLLDDEGHRLTGAAAVLAEEASRMADLVVNAG